MLRLIRLSACALLCACLVALLPAAAAAQEDPPPESTTTTAPTTTEAQTSTTSQTDSTPTTEPSDDGSTSDDGDTVRWIAIALAGAAGIVVLITVISLITGASKRKRNAHDARRRRLQHVLAGATWVHDQVSIDMLATTGQTPQRLQLGWQDARRRMSDLGSECVAIGLESDSSTEAELQAMSHALGELTGALDTSVAVRMREPIDDRSLQAANEAVEGRRRDLAAAMTAIRRRI
jgi:hypothetical protein